MTAEIQPMEEQAKAAAVVKAAGKNKGGAPLQNRNRMTWGGSGWGAIGSFPKGCTHLRRYVGRMRTELQDAVQARHGRLEAYHAGLIQSACRHEGTALLATRWLRLEGDKLPLSERLALTDKICAATDARDRCFRGLGLDHSSTDPRDPEAALDALLAADKAKARQEQTTTQSQGD